MQYMHVPFVKRTIFNGIWEIKLPEQKIIFYDLLIYISIAQRGTYLFDATCTGTAASSYSCLHFSFRLVRYGCILNVKLLKSNTNIKYFLNFENMNYGELV